MPVEPSVVVEEFLAAANRNDLGTMGTLWGNKRGPASTYMDQDELRKRLTVIATYLRHDRYELGEPGALTVSGDEDRRGVAARMTRAGCRAVVPFTLVPWSGRWLIEEIDLAPIGNPSRACPQNQQ